MDAVVDWFNLDAESLSDEGRARIADPEMATGYDVAPLMFFGRQGPTVGF